jgi:TRAP-type mannitol/chloroaromatic compound transport system permease small subunit
LAELLIVISRFVFSYEQAFMGDLVRYWYAALFLISSAYTLYDGGHVRVDVLYSGFSRYKKAKADLAGAFLLGISTCWAILIVGFNGKQSLINMPVLNFEVSQAAIVGMFIKYQMAAFLGVFAITMMIQFLSSMLDNWLISLMSQALEIHLLIFIEANMELLFLALLIFIMAVALGLDIQ